MGEAITGSVLFLVNTIFMLATYALLIRLLFEWSGVDFYNPISQTLYKITAPVLSPFQRFLPTVRGVNLACLLLLFGVITVRFWVTNLLTDFPMHWMGILILATIELVNDVFHIYTLAILAVVILSWISPYQYNPFVSAIYKLTDPLMRRARRWIPPIGVIDISPIAVLLALQLLNTFITKLLVQLGRI